MNKLTKIKNKVIATVISSMAVANMMAMTAYAEGDVSGAIQSTWNGLFNDSDEPIVLNQVADEVAHHKGNVWSHVVSLRREDAIRFGYDNSDRWRELVKRQIPVIAEQSRIPMSNLKWYAAFHDTTHHPHIHLIVYSTNPKQGYLSREGIDKIRSAFANDIFHDGLQSIYQEQTVSRDQLKALSQQQVHEMVMQIQQSDFHNPQLEKLVKTLHEQLQTVSGKKVYGYLPQNVKNTVDEILSELAKDEKIAQLYEKWCDLERLKHKVYTQKELELPPLAVNKVFKPVKNMIIRTVLEYSASDQEEVVIVSAENSEEMVADDFVMPSGCVIEAEVSEQTDAEQSMVADTVFGLFVNLSRMIEDDYSKNHKKLQSKVDSKIQQAIRRHKHELGIKEEPSQTPTY